MIVAPGVAQPGHSPCSKDSWKSLLRPFKPADLALLHPFLPISSTSCLEPPKCLSEETTNSHKNLTNYSLKSVPKLADSHFLRAYLLSNSRAEDELEDSSSLSKGVTSGYWKPFVHTRDREERPKLAKCGEKSAE
jgi:hypothetical protein